MSRHYTVDKDGQDEEEVSPAMGNAEKISEIWISSKV
jgi:hypothetical protein